MKKIFVLFLIFLLVPYSLFGYYIFQVYSHPIKYENEIEIASQKFDVKKTLIASIINVESSYKKNAKSNKSAIGLMQIKLETANFLDDLNLRTRITENELFNPLINITYGIEYISYLMKKFEDEDTVICAYNAGETVVRNWLKDERYSLNKKTLLFIPYSETKNYLKKINKNINFYKKIYDN